MGEKAREVNTFCIQCGTANPDYEIFCGSCGMNMEKQSTPTPVQANPDQIPPQNTVPPASNYPTPPPQMYYGNQPFVESSYPVRWQDATKITVGLLLIISGAWAGLFGFAILAESPTGTLIFLALLSFLPIFIGYKLLVPFMGGSEMVKAGLATFGIGVAVYMIALATIIFILIFFLGGLF